MRKFEKISKEQWEKDITCDSEVYRGGINYDDEFILPKRGTKNSAGYDFVSPVNIIVPAHGVAKIPTGVKVQLEPTDLLSLYPRSSIGFKTNIRLANTVGIVDSDYYNNPDNEGHIWIKLYNPGDNDFIIKAGDKFAQGIITQFLTVDDEEEINATREGGLGSTGA